MAILPFSKKQGLQPDRNLVFWPYSDIKDERFELQDELILLHGQASNVAFKAGNRNSVGWIAYASKDALFIKRFPVTETENYPDLGCNVEAYVKDSCLELESLEPMRIFHKNESVTHEETWEMLAGEYPATPETAQRIRKQLSQIL
jgi:hypothetical protein